MPNKTTRQEKQDKFLADFGNKCNAFITNFTTKHTPTNITCRQCKTTKLISPFEYINDIPCCVDEDESDDDYEDAEDKRNPQVDMEEVERKVDKVCAERNGQCLNIIRYVNENTHLKWKCNVCTKYWKATLNNIYHSKSWCIHCTKELSERKCRSILVHLYPTEDFSKVRPQWLKYKNNVPLELDCFNLELKLALEYQGIQHFEEVPYFCKSQNDLIDQQARDAFKVNECPKNEIDLILVTYKHMKQGGAHVKKYIYDICKRLHGTNSKFVEPTNEWLKDNNIVVPDNIRARHIKETILTYLKEHRPSYKFENPDVVIAGCEEKFKLICDLGHTFETYKTNLCSTRHRGCPNPIHRPSTNISIDGMKEICKAKDGICLNYDTYVNNNTFAQMVCNGCGNSWSKRWRSIVREKQAWCPHCPMIYDYVNDCETIMEILYPCHKFAMINNVVGGDFYTVCEELKIVVGTTGLVKIDTTPVVNYCTANKYSLIIVDYAVTNDIPSIKKFLYNSVKGNKYCFNPASNWVNVDSVTYIATHANRKQKIIAKLQATASHCHFTDPKVVIQTSTDAFELTCDRCDKKFHAVMSHVNSDDIGTITKHNRKGDLMKHLDSLAVCLK
jgi:hypothetical protein